MATHDYVIANGTGAAVRSDINGALAAIVSQNSNASEPATMYAYQWWADTTTGLLKIRNAANSAWVTIGTLASANLGLLPLAGGTMTGVLAVTAGTAALPGIAVSGDTNTGIYSPGADQLAISTGGTVRATVDSSGNIVIGTSSTSGARLFVAGGALTSSAAGGVAISATLSAGRLTSDSSNINSINTYLDNSTIEIAPGSTFKNGISINGNGTSADTNTIKFFTANTERARIDSSGRLLVGTTNTNPVSNNVAGVATLSTGQTLMSADGATPLFINRITNDGNLIDFYQGAITEGTISVSGTTVSYNGAHLSRWSQLPGGTERIEILRGTVLSNIDEMCGWGEEDNEQLNRMKVSDVEGDKDVSGVFQCWDDDDDTYTDDFYCAMTGDFIIRIAEGVTVERGDLLMSAGDGTAKPQDDDIIRSKTVAKVTSTHVTCTYEDGSYCVPCVLMAC